MNLKLPTHLVISLKMLCLHLVNVLPTVSKIFERIMQKQINDYIRIFVSPFLWGYRKRFSTQYALLLLIERWRLCLDKQGFAEVLLMNLSKAFNAINHEILIVVWVKDGYFINNSAVTDRDLWKDGVTWSKAVNA